MKVKVKDFTGMSKAEILKWICHDRPDVGPDETRAFHYNAWMTYGAGVEISIVKLKDGGLTWRRLQPPTHAQNRQRAIAEVLRCAIGASGNLSQIDRRVSLVAAAETETLTSDYFVQMRAEISKCINALDRLKRTALAANIKAVKQTQREKEKISVQTQNELLPP
jgi:hypothetical protein